MYKNIYSNVLINVSISSLLECPGADLISTPSDPIYTDVGTESTPKLRENLPFSSNSTTIFG